MTMLRRKFLQTSAAIGAFFQARSSYALMGPLSAQVEGGPMITVDPDTLILDPGGSAQVTVTVDPGSPSGTGSVCVTVEVPPQYDHVISGNTGPLTILPGETGHIEGDVNLTGDLIVEGLLTGVDTFILTGNGFQILTQNGGVLDLAGVEKTAWLRWGDTPVGWQVGDRLAVAPTTAAIYAATEIVWGGSWTSTTRPATSPDVLLIDGSTARPELANLSQTILLQNLRRVHFHDGAGVQNLRYVRLLDCGTSTVGDYPIHFHLNGEPSRGSLIEDVIVEGSKNRGFVPHGSHGIVMRGCVAYKSQSQMPFWWDPPLDKSQTVNNSNDTVWEANLALVGYNLGRQGAAFFLGAGSGNKCIDNAVAGFYAVGENLGNDEVSGFHWAAAANQNVGGNVWDFHGNVAHNNSNGWRIWQNDSNPHNPHDNVTYRHRKSGILHGAYLNGYKVERHVSHGDGNALLLHALGGVRYFDMVTDGRLSVERHFQASGGFVELTRTGFTGVTYNETSTNSPASHLRFIDCGLDPTDFLLTVIRPDSQIEIVEAGILVHSWTGGVWT